MDAGLLRDEVTLEAEDRTDNGQGGFVSSWSPVTTMSANLVALTGDEALQNGIQRSTATYRVTIRRRDTITAQHRLKWRGTILAIHSVLQHPRWPQEAMLLICEIGNGS